MDSFLMRNSEHRDWLRIPPPLIPIAELMEARRESIWHEEMGSQPCMSSKQDDFSANTALYSLEEWNSPTQTESKGHNVEVPQVKETLQENDRETLQEQEKESPDVTAHPTISEHRSIYENFFSLLCPFCGKTFSERGPWRHHLTAWHQFNYDEDLRDKRVKCMHCDVLLYVRNIQILEDHKITHLPFNRYIKCKICNGRFRGNTNIALHMRKKHAKILAAAGVPGPRLKKLNKEHTKSNQGTTIQKSKKATLLQISQQYSNDDSSSSSAETSGCGSATASEAKRTFYSSNEAAYEQHIIRICPFCGVEFANKINWRNHLDIEHQFCLRSALNMNFLQNEKAQCNDCNAIISSKNMQALQAHRIKHLPHKQPLMCRICRKRFSHPNSSYKHLHSSHRVELAAAGVPEYAPTHIPLPQLVCCYCHEGFDIRSKLVNHMIQYHEELNENKTIHICPDCGIELSVENEWLQHMVHEHGYDSPAKSSFNVYREVGSFKSSYQCIDCGSVYRRLDLLKFREHALQHMPVKCFKCRHCKFIFQHKIEIRFHVCDELLCSGNPANQSA